MSDYLKYKNIGILFLLLLSVTFSSCGEAENESTAPAKIDVSDKLKRIAADFWQEMCEKNYKNARKYTTNSSEKSLVKLSQYANEVSLAQFSMTDSCWFDKDTSRAYCSCLFLQNNQDKREVVQLVKGIYGWQVEYILGITNENVLMYDYTLVEQSQSSRKFDRYYTLPALDVNYLDYYLNDIGGDLKLGLVETYEMRDEVEEKLNAFALSFDFFEEPIELNVASRFENNKSFEITITQFDADHNLEVFQQIVLRLIEQYGVPYNAADVSSSEYYKYISYRWFYKSYNQQIEIRNFGTSIVVVFSVIV
jgi:hypothetical protein